MHGREIFTLTPDHMQLHLQLPLQQRTLYGVHSRSTEYPTFDPYSLPTPSQSNNTNPSPSTHHYTQGTQPQPCAHSSSSADPLYTHHHHTSQQHSPYAPTIPQPTNNTNPTPPTSSATRPFSLLLTSASRVRPQPHPSASPNTWTPTHSALAPCPSPCPSVAAGSALLPTCVFAVTTTLVWTRGFRRNTYNPSHLVRKRRHGFLKRWRTKSGRKILRNRIMRGKLSTLTH